jgi:GNAT superfamily N-acetyltransferase
MAADFRIRPATAADREALTALWQAFMHEQSAHDDRLPLSDDATERWQNDLPAWLDDSTVQLWVAEHDGNAVGFARAHRTGPPPVYADCTEVYIDEVFVHKAHRRHGMATALVDAAAKWAATVEADRLRLSTVAANEAATAFWQTYGAAPLATIWTRPVDAESGSEEEEGDVNEGSAKIGFDWN